jgi:hypothetical protein
MPICLNLLAEAQAAEDLRRRDPVKRAIFGAVLLVALMLVWSSSVQVKAMLAKSDVGKAEARLAVHAKEYQQVVQDTKKTAELNQKLAALSQLATNRFLYGSLLNGLQQTVIDDVQLTRLKVEQTYAYDEGSKPTTNDTRVIPGRPATVTEKIALTLGAKDRGANPGDQIGKLKSAIASNPYFQKLLGKTNEVLVSDWSQVAADPDGRSFITFRLDCRLPERTR